MKKILNLLLVIIIIITVILNFVSSQEINNNIGNDFFVRIPEDELHNI